MRTTLARGAALFFGAFGVVNGMAGLVDAHLDGNGWWISLGRAGDAVLPVASVLLLGWAWRPWSAPYAPVERIRRPATLVAVGLVACMCLADAAQVAWLVATDRLKSGFPLPFSLVAAAMLAWILVEVRRTLSIQGSPTALPGDRVRRAGGVIASAAACAALFAVGQMACFGKTDYSRPGHVAVVFGARAYADGTPSTALADRVRTAVALHRAGVVDALVMSGGPGDGDAHETEVMRAMAVAMGVPARDVVLDPDGLNTERTVLNSLPIIDSLGGGRILAVSHWFHLPRIKMAYRRAGREVYTVPARESYVLTQTPWLVARETLAFWLYWGKPFLVRNA